MGGFLGIFGNRNSRLNKLEKELGDIKTKISTMSSPALEIPKYYIFNETGNILLCATEDSLKEFESGVKESFVDVSVFFAAMTKALSSVINENTGRPYSIYNYDAVRSMLSASGMFVEVNVERKVFSSEKIGESIGRDFLKSVIGKKDIPDNGLNFFNSMSNGARFQMGEDKNGNYSIDINDYQTAKSKRVRGGSLFFVCELLLGMPQTTAILVSLEPDSKKLVKVKPEEDSEKEEGQKRDEQEPLDDDPQNIFDLAAQDEKDSKGKIRSWTYSKRSYLFVPPRFIKKNLDTLSDGDDSDYTTLVNALASNLRGSEKAPQENTTPDL